MIIFKVLKNEYFWLFVIVFLALIVRLYKIDSPLADWHSWRQADTAAVTRNFIKEGFNPFIPKYDDMSGAAESPMVNSLGFRFVEFPVYNIFVYPLYLLFGVNEYLSRLVSVLFSLGSIVFVFLIAKRFLGILTSLVSAFLFAFLPFSIFFSRTTLPEPTFLFFALGMVYFTEKWIWEGNFKWGIWSFIFITTSFVIKPWAIFFYLPLIYSVYIKGNKNFFVKKFLPLSIIAFIPFTIWRFWILQEPEGIPASNWLLNGDGIRFRPAFFWWIISERIGGEILGVTGFALFILGIIKKSLKGYFLHMWLLSMILYLIIFATGNVRHNYYQFIITPIISIFTAIGIGLLFKGIKDFLPRIVTIVFAICLISLSFYFTWKVDREFYRINNPRIVEVGKIADKILPNNALVLAPYSGDTAFLYQINRRGFPVSILPIEEMVSDYGVTHYVSTIYDEKTNWVMRHFKILLQTPDFLIADVTQLTSPFDKMIDPQP